MTTTPAHERARTRTAWSVLAVAYGVASYVFFVAVFAYAVAFLADVVVPRTVDAPSTHATTLVAVLVDTALLALFAVQHTVMARPGFKQWWNRYVPRHVERSTYVLFASASLALLFWLWQPIGTVVWDVQAPAARAVIWVLCGLGWLWALAMSYAIDHWDLFGLSRVLRHLRGQTESPSSFRLPLPYRLARHPMMIGFVVAFLAAPTMTVGHLLFAVLGCAYIVVGVRFEERDLAAELPEYAAYAAVTPRFLPRVGRRG